MVYAWVAAAYAGFSPRLVLMAALVTVWGIRLTVNFALKGAYTRKFWAGEEDYRWRVLRSKPAFKPRWKWTMFNLFFISGYQNALILLFTLPAVVAMQHPGALGVADLAVAVLMLFFIAYETMADIQQWRFQQSKKKAALTGNDPEGHLKRGFINRGLWAHSRHPNYFAEQAVWICFYLFSVSAGGQWFNWSISGCLLLIVLFQGSSSFGEEISAGKYPEYRDYQKRVPRFFPIPKKLISIDHC